MQWDYEKIEDDKEPPEDMRESYSSWTFPQIVPNKLSDYGYVIRGYDPENSKKLKIGYRADISSGCVLFAHHGLTIEPYVQIGPNSSIMSYSTIDNKKGKVTLKRNCRIGTHSSIMPGITVGENSIIGAHSFVNENIPDNVLAVGVPAKIVRRLDEK